MYREPWPLHQWRACFGPFMLSPSERLLQRDGVRVPLGGRAFDLLLALVESAGQVVGKRELLARVWPNMVVSEGCLRFHIAALRKVLDDSAARRYIVNTAGLGYTFVAPVERIALPWQLLSVLGNFSYNGLMKPNGPPPLSQLLCYKLYATSLRMTQLYKPLLEALSLTYPQFLVMVVLWEEEGIGMGELAERLGLDAGSVTPLVKRLEASGYLIRSKNPHDERNRILTLSKEGKQLRQAGRDVNRQVIAQRAITATRAGSLMEHLDELRQHQGDALNEP